MNFLKFLQREARAHFDCPVMVGMEVENNGGYGTKLTHFEKRLLEVRFSISRI